MRRSNITIGKQISVWYRDKSIIWRKNENQSSDVTIKIVIDLRSNFKSTSCFDLAIANIGVILIAILHLLISKYSSVFVSNSEENMYPCYRCHGSRIFKSFDERRLHAQIVHPESTGYYAFDSMPSSLVKPTRQGKNFIWINYYWYTIQGFILIYGIYFYYGIYLRYSCSIYFYIFYGIFFTSM